MNENTPLKRSKMYSGKECFTTVLFCGFKWGTFLTLSNFGSFGTWFPQLNNKL